MIYLQNPSGVHDIPDDAHYPAHAPRMSSRLCEEAQRQYWLQSASQLVHTDS